MNIGRINQYLKARHPKYESVHHDVGVTEIKDLRVSMANDATQAELDAVKADLSTLSIAGKVPGEYIDKRREDFQKEFPITDQIDAIWKYAMMTPTERNTLAPDPNAPIDTPAGALAKWQEIKQRHKKD